MPSNSGSSTPLPSFTPPRSLSGNHSNLLTALSAIASPSNSNSEKHSLSTRSRNSSSSLRSRFTDLFQPLRIGGAGTSNGRTFTVPVFRFLHPGRESLRSQLRKDGRVSYAQAGQIYPRGRTLFAVVGTFVGSFLVLFLFISLLRPFLPSPRRLPFIGEADTLIFSDAEIEKVWLWEIASGRYPSKRKTDFPLGEDVTARVYRAGSVTGPTLQNPGVPKLGLQEMKDSLFQQTRKQSTSGVRQPLVVIPQPDPTLSPVGAPRQTLAIPSRPIYSPKYDAPSTVPPRPVPNSAIDLDTVMDYCDFSTGQYVRDCLESAFHRSCRCSVGRWVAGIRDEGFPID